MCIFVECGIGLGLNGVLYEMGNVLKEIDGIEVG